MDVERMQAHCLAKPGVKSGAIPDDELLEAVDESYRLVVSKLPSRLRPEGWELG